MEKVLGIVGPTAVGKTQLSIKIAQKFNGEIISGDSMQIYQKLNIGTAKVTPAEMDGVPHHLINIKTVHERFSASDFKLEAERLITEITNRNKLPIIVGGTGFYLKALLDNLELGGADENKDQIDQVRAELNQKTNDELLALLKQVDLKAFQQIDHQNRRRIIRALEVDQVNQQKFSNQAQRKAQYDSLLIGLNTDRIELYNRINRRVELMMDDGLLSEATWLFKQKEVPQATKGIGYREWKDYFTGDIDLKQVIELIQKDSRHYAKRQLTWFRNQMDVNWFDILQNENDPKRIDQKIESWLRKNDELER